MNKPIQVLGIISKKLVVLGGQIWVIMPIIFGIIIPMVYMIPLAYSSWHLIFSGVAGGWADAWLAYDYWHLSSVVPLLIGEGVMFLIGLSLFLSGLITLAKNRLQKKKVTRNGIYHYIRHPQHIGITLMLLPFAMYIPLNWQVDGDLFQSDDIGIRIGEILSWALFSTILILTSLFEEKKLAGKYPESYIPYLNSTGFYLPRSGKHRSPSRISKSEDFSTKQFRWKIGFTIAGYLFFNLVTYGISLILLRFNLLWWTL